MSTISLLFSLTSQCGFSGKSPLVLIVIGFLVSNQALCNQTVSLVGDPWPPYVNGELGENAVSGVAVEIALEVFSQIENVDVKFPLIPWNRALREVEEGVSDGIVILLKTTEREKYMHYTDPLVIGYSLIWSSSAEPSGHFEWTTSDDLLGFSIGIIDGYSYGEQLDKKIKNGELNAVSVPTVKQLFAMLANRRVDLALATDAVGYSLARQYPEAKIAPARRAINSETFYMGISRKSWAVKLIPAINSAIKSLHADGTINRIVRGER